MERAVRKSLKRVEEFARRAGIGAAGVGVADLRGEEIEEAMGGARAGGGDEGRGAINEGNELIHSCCYCNLMGKPLVFSMTPNPS